MPRNLTLAASQSVLARQTGQMWVALLTIYHPLWPVVIRRALFRSDFESRGGIFAASVFRPKVRDQVQGGGSTWQIEIDNTDQVIQAELKRLNEKPFIWVEEVLASDPHTVQTTTGILRDKIKSFHIRGATLTCIVERENLSDEGYPRGSINPSNFQSGF